MIVKIRRIHHSTYTRKNNIMIKTLSEDLTLVILFSFTKEVLGASAGMIGIEYIVPVTSIVRR